MSIAVTIKPTAVGPVLCTGGRCDRRTGNGQCIWLNDRCRWLNDDRGNPVRPEVEYLLREATRESVVG